MRKRCFFSSGGRWVTLLLCLFFISACALLPESASTVHQRDTLQDFVLEGRFSLRHEDRNHSGRMNWRHVGPTDEVLLSSPFGQGMAEISANPQGASLTLNDGTVHVAPDVETLTRQVLDYPLPLKQLADWVRARTGSKTGAAAYDAQGRLLRLRHEGWFVDYAYDSEDPQALPMRIIVDRAGAFELRLRIDAWHKAD